MGNLKIAGRKDERNREQRESYRSECGGCGGGGLIRFVVTRIWHRQCFFSFSIFLFCFSVIGPNGLDMRPITHDWVNFRD
jgi:hypothetical protein